MQLAPRAFASHTPFVRVEPITVPDGAAPKLEATPFGERPLLADHLVTIRYVGRDENGARHQVTVHSDSFATGVDWMRVRGSRADAVRAARQFAVVGDDKPYQGRFARTSVAVLDGEDGVWNLQRLAFWNDPMFDGEGMVHQLPIDPAVGESTSTEQLPYGFLQGVDFDHPDTVSVQFDDPRVAAVVGVDSIAVAPSC